MGVACSTGGRRTDNFYSALLQNRVAYHDFERLTVLDDEKPRLIANIGNKKLLILRNHGLLTCGRSIPEAFYNMWALQRSCEVQVACDATGKNIIPVSDEILAKAEQLMTIQSAGTPVGQLEFSCPLYTCHAASDPPYLDTGSSDHYNKKTHRACKAS